MALKQKPDRPRPSARASSKAKTLKKKVSTKLRSIPGVVGVGVGYKVVAGRTTKKLCIRVYVRRKVDEEKLRRSELIPTELRGIETDVIEYREPTPTPGLSPHARWPHLVGGIGIMSWRRNRDALQRTGNPGAMGGTLGMIVFDKHSGEEGLVTNAHVVHRPGWKKGDPILQPGSRSYLPMKHELVVANLERLVFSKKVDGSFSLLNGRRLALPRVRGRGTMSGIRDATLGTWVWRSGITSDAVGWVDDDDCDIEVGGRDYINQIIVSGDGNMSEKGDSGGVWVDRDNWAVALHHGGLDYAVASPMPAVAKQLRVTMRHGVPQQAFVAATSTSLL